MDELEQELTTSFDERTSQDETTLESFDTTQSVEAEPAQDAVNQSYWQEHENAKKGFWKSEQDVIKGYDYYDKKFKPIETVLKQRGIQDHDGLTGILSEYDTYKDPNSEINQAYNAMQSLQNHPTYGQKFQEFVNGIVEQEEMQRYGAKLPYEVKQQLQKVEQLEKWQKDQEYQAEVKTYESKLDETCNKIEEFCKGKGIELGESELEEHLRDCLENKVSMSGVFDYYVSKNIDKILGNVQSKASQAVVNNISKNGKSAIASGARTTPSNNATPDSLQSLKDAVGKELGFN